MAANDKKSSSGAGLFVAFVIGSVVGYKVRESMASSDRELAAWRARQEGSHGPDEWEKYDD